MDEMNAVNAKCALYHCRTFVNLYRAVRNTPCKALLYPTHQRLLRRISPRPTYFRYLRRAQAKLLRCFAVTVLNPSATGGADGGRREGERRAVGILSPGTRTEPISRGLHRPTDAPLLVTTD